MTPDAFAPALLGWFDQHGRHDLPWQAPRSAYRVWLSEVMLQQTQVTTAIPYFLRFVARFPDIESLARAPVDDVLHLWSGLGYYARARNLQLAAQIVVAEHRGVLPDEPAALIALPGIGRSTAGAILALAHGRREPILDGNVKRVLARWFAIAGSPAEAAVLARLWAASALVTPFGRVDDYTQAVMDLGATLCVRSRPRCGDCPVSAGCAAYRDGLQASFPGRKRRSAARRQRSVAWLVARGPAGYYLVQRPPRGIWGGLWGFPEFADPAAAVEFVARHFVVVGEPQLPTPIGHSFTHFDLTITPVVVPVSGDRPAVEEAATLWYNPRSPSTLGLAAPVSGLISRLAAAANALPPAPNASPP